LASDINRQRALTILKQQGVFAVFHYVPLHDAPAGRRYGRVHGSMTNTNTLSDRLIRLPMWIGLDTGKQQCVVETLRSALT
jgi:dTDP-4-amino-4,6-dideoxygalactose transaminase